MMTELDRLVALRQELLEAEILFGILRRHLNNVESLIEREVSDIREKIQTEIVRTA